MTLACTLVMRHEYIQFPTTLLMSEKTNVSSTGLLHLFSQKRVVHQIKEQSGGLNK